VDAAADAAGGFEEGDAVACFGEDAGGGETGHACSDDEDFGFEWHSGLDAIEVGLGTDGLMDSAGFIPCR
jgi:hypothetical protein